MLPGGGFGDASANAGTAVCASLWRGEDGGRAPEEVTRKLRLFLDSNVLTGGIVAPWGLDKAVLSLCAASVCRLVLAEAVRDEVEENLLVHAGGLPSEQADRMIEDYRRLIQLTKPEMVPYPELEAVVANRRLIRHASDVPVLLLRWRRSRTGF